MALRPAAAHASRADGGTKPARVNPHSRIFFKTAGSFGGLFHGMIGKKLVSEVDSAATTLNLTMAATITKSSLIPRCIIMARKETMEMAHSPLRLSANISRRRLRFE